jgi:hypothetical protein
MLVLLCIQVVQTNKNESSLLKIIISTTKRYVNLPRKKKILIKKI